MLVSHSIQLLPNQKTERYFRQASGTARMVWNWALAEWERQYKEGGKPNANDLDKTFNATKRDQFPWMYDENGRLVVSNCVTQRVIKIDLKGAFQKFFKGQAKRPKFKKKGLHDGFYMSNDRIKLDPECNRIWIQKGGWVRTCEKLRFDGKIMGATISRSADKWFIAVQVDVAEPAIRPKNQGVVGVDLGISALATLSDGTKAESPAPLRASLQKLRRMQRSFSRMNKGGANWKKQKLRIAKLHRRIAGIRSNSLHQLTAYLTRKFETVVIEDLNIKGMLANRKQARAIADVGFYEFRRQIEYKAKREGVNIIFADRWLPSSKTCSCCGAYKGDLGRNPIFSCDHCGMVLDRDHNAAINLAVLADQQTVTAWGRGGAGHDLGHGETAADEPGTGKPTGDDPDRGEPRHSYASVD